MHAVPAFKQLHAGQRTHFLSNSRLPIGCRVVDALFGARACLALVRVVCGCERGFRLWL
jgi:hypothetical protein